MAGAELLVCPAASSALILGYLGMKQCHLGDAADGLVADSHIDIGAERQVEVDARAEFDEAHVVFDFGFDAGVPLRRQSGA